MKLPKFIISALRDQLVQRVATKRKPDVIIGGKDDPYLLRWHVIPRNKWFNAYFHIFIRSDDDRALHDHPWWSCSVILEHGYWEILPTVSDWVVDSGDPMSVPNYQKTRAVYRPEGSVVFRRPLSAHRVQLGDEFESWEPPAMTLFLTGPRVREWGFYCPQGWKDWRDFTNFRSGDSTTRGPGCDP